jgi:hypothetical protein
VGYEPKTKINFVFLRKITKLMDCIPALGPTRTFPLVSNFLMEFEEIFD